ncbi:MAG: hypothetical protein Q7S58_13560 [Candidatus Binatus sp.]|uniref:hypothetical protein n=1 Tax=Candidatus Binatus sp. TaxID=2811406 RepID=UPI002725C8E3|nr:hypothetical protein [Candidatus Binatus sp.]MDO8433426.1 hypothetical protein [Candidatus Binatus sp.]
MREELDKYPQDDLLNVSVDELCNYCERKYSYDVLDVNIEDQSLQHDEFQFPPVSGRGPEQVTGTLIRVRIPFSGNSTMLYCTPSAADAMLPEEAEIGLDEHTIILYFPMRPDDDSAGVKARIARDIDRLKRCTDKVNRDLITFNQSIKDTARQHIEARRERLLKAAAKVAALEIPLKKREGAPRTYAIPDVRKRAELVKPVSKAKALIPHPTLSDATYEDILEILWLMARVMECSPRTVALLDEETLRTLFLVQLNAQYEGRATGETFNFRGKSDILIQAEDGGLHGPVFVAECKIWRGQKSFQDTIDQLQRYITWRDSKTAILIFCKNKTFSTVLSTIPDTAVQHPNFVRSEESKRETEFRFVFHRSDDKDREFRVAVLAFHVPSENDESET